MSNRTLLFATAALAVVFPVVALAAPLAIPNAFSDGEIISAAAFNENFDAIADAVNDNDARLADLEDGLSSGGVPVGTIAFFAADMCPTGWAEYADLRGRVPVGLAQGGEAEATVGTALEPAATRTISQVPNHTHPAGGSGTASSTNSAHSHSVGGGGHQNHEIASGGSHDHEIEVNTGGFGTSTAIGGTSAGSPTGTTLPIHDDGAHTHGMAPANGVLGSHTHSVSAGSHQHQVAITSGNTGNNTGGVGSIDVTMPYIQLLACEKL